MYISLRYATLPCVVLIALACSTQAQPTTQPSQVLRIGFWNIEHLGMPQQRSGIAKDIAQDPRHLADYIRQANVRILSLSEIYDEDTRHDEVRTNETLQRTLDLLNERGDAEWRYVLLPNKNPRDRSQLCGIAWDDRAVRMVGQPYRVPVRDEPDDRMNTWDRHPSAVQFTLSLGAGKTDLVVVPIHMKSSYGGDAAGRLQRAKEAELLAEVLDTLRSHFRDQDLVLLGDFNSTDNTEPALTTYRGAGLLDLNRSNTPTTYYEESALDRILVADGQPEFPSAGFVVLRASDENTRELRQVNPATDRTRRARELHKKYRSDHYLVLTSVKVLADDD